MARILVVDDEPVVALALKALLSSHGYEAVTAGSGEEALEILGGAPVDLVFLDVLLPGLSGFETCTRIRAAHGPTLPVVMISARPDSDAVLAGYEAGADDFMAKPVDNLALVLKVQVLLRLKALHDELRESQRSLKQGVTDLATLHEIGRDWSLIAEPEEFHRMVTHRLAALIGAPICLIALYDGARRQFQTALPAFGIEDQHAQRLRYTVTPEYRALWNFSSGRPYLSNRARTDPRLVPEVVAAARAESVVLVPMLSEGRLLGLLVAANKPGGFTEADVQLVTIFAGPAATFLRGRQIFDEQRRHATRLERLSELARDMSAARGRAALLALAVSRIQRDLGCERAAFYGLGDGQAPRLEAESGPAGACAPNPELLRWAVRSASPLRSGRDDAAAELAVPVRAGEAMMGVLDLLRPPEQPFGEDEENLLLALAGTLAVTLQNVQSLAASERLARQMATLYDVGLETAALRDLRQLFLKGGEEAGRLIKADHTSVFRFDEATQTLGVFAAWARQPSRQAHSQPTFRLGEGIAGRVAVDWMPAMVNEAPTDSNFVPKGNPVQRLLCVPLTFYDQERESVSLFGVLNATRRPGAPVFTQDDLEYLTRFAGQLSIAVANSMAFASERERGEQLALVNTLTREIAGILSRERILEIAARRIQEAFETPLVLIGVPEGDSGQLRVAVSASRDPRPESFSAHSLAEGIAGRACRDKRTVVVLDAAQEGERAWAIASTRSGVAVPIRSGVDVTAVIQLESDLPGAFGRAMLITLETLAEGIGIILRNAELFQALEETNSRLVELDRTKSELVNLVAHDFRAPLAGVLGYAELLEWKPDAPREERVDQARAIIQSATHMASMVDKTLKTTRIETGQLPFDFGVVDLAAVAREVLARFPRAPQHSLEAEVPEDPLPCWADRDRIAEVLDNLLSNAVKYSPEGGPIGIELGRRDELVEVTVRDQGIGIAPQDLGRLFRPFSRVRNRQTAKIEGTGLGLYLCDRIVKAHGGQLRVESRPGVGSSFTFSLPLFGAAAQVRGPLLLVAATDDATRRAVRGVAKKLGFDTHEVEDGVDAIEAAQRLLPAAALIERILPRLGGVEVAQRLKETPATAHIPLLALAPEADLGGRAGLFGACLPKPVDGRALAAALEAVGISRTGA